MRFQPSMFSAKKHCVLFLNKNNALQPVESLTRGIVRLTVTKRYILYEYCTRSTSIVAPNTNRTLICYDIWFVMSSSEETGTRFTESIYAPLSVWHEVVAVQLRRDRDILYQVTSPTRSHQIPQPIYSNIPLLGCYKVEVIDPWFVTTWGTLCPAQKRREQGLPSRYTPRWEFGTR